MDTISFNRGIPAERSLPVEKVEEITSKIMDQDGTSLLQYGDSRGFPPLRKKLAEDSEGITKDEVLVSNGSLQILDIITKLYVDKEDHVVIERPSYDRAITIFDRTGGEVVGVDLQKDGVDIEGFERILDTYQPELFYTIADFHNPTGVTTSGSKRERIAELAADYNTLIVEDSPYRKLRYRGEEEPTLRSFKPENVLKISSFSKLICPGIRVGWVMGQPSIVKEIADYSEDTYVTPNLLSQGIVNRLIRDGWLEENLQELISLYRPRLQVTLGSLEEYFPGADWIQAEGGFFVGLWLPDKTKEDEFYNRAKEESLILSSSDGFFPDQSNEGFVRLPFPALTTGEIEEGVKRLAKAWHEL